MDGRGSLITRPIEAQAAAGIEEIAVVVGYLGDIVRKALGDGCRFGVKLHYIYNADYLGGNAVSVHKARDWTQGAPVILCMGDHLIEEKLVRHLVESHAGNEMLCVDRVPADYHDVDEATKVTVDIDGCITDIGKRLVRWDALDTGVFLLTEDFFQALDELVCRRGISTEMGDVIRFLISRGHCFDTCDVSGCFWMDVDTEEDLNRVSGIAEANGRRV